MASEPLMFVTGSKTFEITEYSTSEGVGNKNYIQSERFTVGGYDWVIQYYPQGNMDSTSDHVSVYVKVLNATKEVRALYNFRMWDCTTAKWSTITPASSELGTFLMPPMYYRAWGYEKYIKRSDLGNYLQNNTLKIKCTLFVITPQKSEISYRYGFHTASYAPPNAPSNMYTKLPRQPTLRIYCKAIKDFSLTIRNGTVVLAPADPSDLYQHWVKDMSYGHGNEDKDIFGNPAFALVNSVTGEALKTPAGENEEVSLVPYNPNHNSMKWSTADSGAIRVAATTILNMTAILQLNEVARNDGAKIVVKTWENSQNNQVQRWNIVPYNANLPYKVISNL